MLINSRPLDNKIAHRGYEKLQSVYNTHRVDKLTSPIVELTALQAAGQKYVNMSLVKSLEANDDSQSAVENHDHQS